MSDEPEVVDQGEAGEQPTAVEMAADTLIQAEGFDEPITWGDFTSQHVPKSEYTSKTQALAEEREQWEAKLKEAAQHETTAQQWQAHARQLEQRLQQFQQPQHQQPTGDPFDSVYQQVDATGGYVDKSAFQNAVSVFQQQVVAPLTQRNQQLEQGLMGMAEVVKNLNDKIDGISSERTDAKEQRMAQAALKNYGITEDVEGYGDLLELMVDMSRIYEPTHTEKASGKGMEDVFPTWGSERLGNIEKLLRKASQKQAERATAAQLPGTGGDASPSRPVSRKYRSPEEAASDAAERLGLTD
jgi:hypothetical protein